MTCSGRVLSSSIRALTAWNDSLRRTGRHAHHRNRGCWPGGGDQRGQAVVRLALVDGVREEPAPGLRGKCCLCGDDMIARCGRFVRWHWAHKARISCDPWQETETDWHRYWKDAFPFDCQEVVHVDDRTHEKHIADVRTPSGFVVEVQHSPIAEHEASARERFYGNMIWIVDARHLDGWFCLGMAKDLASCTPMMYQIEWWGRSRLLERWANSTVHVYFDAMNSAACHEGDDGKMWFFPRETPVPVQDRILWRLLEFDAFSKRGLIAPVQAQVVVEAVMNGEAPPLHRCEEQEAWRFRREFRTLADQVDECSNNVSAGSSRSGAESDDTSSGPSTAPVADEDLPF